MKPLRSSSTALFAASRFVPILVAPILVAPILVAPILVATPALAQTDRGQRDRGQTDRAQTDRAQTDQAQRGQATSLLEALSLVSGRMLVAPVVAPEVSHDGDHFHVHIPLPQLTAPPDAAIEVTAVPLDSGVWNITGLTLPQTGTLQTQGAPGAGPRSLRFSIGQQTAHARIDPTLSVPSPYAMALSDMAFHLDGAKSPAELTIGQMTVEGTITGDPDRRMTTRSHATAENWHLTLTTQGGTQGGTKPGAPFILSLRTMDVRDDVNGLDRAQADRLREAARAISASRRTSPPVPGQPAAMSPAVREQLHAIIEASAGLLSGLDVEETLQGLHFDAGAGNNGDIGTISLAMAGGAADNRVAGHVDIGLNDMTLAALPAVYAPRRVAIKTAMSGIPVEPLRQLLRQATEADADPVALRAQAIALLSEPGAHAGIDSLLIEAGPLLLQGSARLRAMPDGSAGFNIHLTARGLDAMLAQVEADPKVQQVMPMLFLAKGMGKQEGDTLVWDIAFADGLVTVNGIPMGQRGGGAPGVPPGVRPGGGPPANR
jgi:hypothetical protein